MGPAAQPEGSSRCTIPSTPRREVDLFAGLPLPWSELQAGAQLVEVDGVQIPVVAMAHLIAMKEAAGRPQDLADIAALRALEPDRG